MQVADLLSSSSASVAAVVILLSILYYFISNRNILPGPVGLPYLGLWPSLTHETCHLQLQDLSKKYGDLYSFRYCGKLIINLGSIKAMREAHVNKSDCFAGRFTDFNILTFTIGDGVAMTNGEPWKVLRKFFIQAFKEYGMTAMRDNVAGPIYDSVSALTDDLRKAKGKSFNVIETLTVRCTGTMKKVLFGEDSISTKTLLDMNEAYGVALDSMTGVSMLLIGNFGRFIFNVSPRYREALRQHVILRQLLYDVVEKMQASFDENHVTCVVDSYFKERSQRKRKNDPTWKYFSDKVLVESLAQFVGDGILSVAYFIGIFLNAIVEHPEEQDKIFAEILETVGPNREITIEDKSKMPYTNAFINEVIRTSNFFTLFPSLECTKETTIRGYRIPKGSITLLNIWGAHHDPELYENPDSFDPNRYIAKPGKPRAELPVLFGIGKRACTGEPFVMMESFIFFANILKNFKVSEPAGLTTKSDMFLMTGNMELRFEPRSKH